MCVCVLSYGHVVIILLAICMEGVLYWIVSTQCVLRVINTIILPADMLFDTVNIKSSL